MRVSNSSSSQARRSLSHLTCASKASRSLMTLRYSLQSASKLTSLTANRRTVSSSSENLANNVRMRSTTLWSPSPRYEQNDWAPPCSVRRFSRADIRRFRLVFHVSDLIDDFGVGQRRDVA